MPSGKPVVECRQLSVLAVGLVLVLGACAGPTEPTVPAAPGVIAVRTDRGVTDTTITLGVLGDRRLDTLTSGNQLWADDVNTVGGVCGRRIELAVVDHGGDVSAARALYPQVEPRVLGLLQLSDPAVQAALGPELAEDGLLAAQPAWSGAALDDPGVLAVGTSYDVEVVNGLGYLQQEDLISDGDEIGHIHLDDGYGDNALEGSRFYAEEHDLTVHDAAVTASDDLTEVVDRLADDGVTALVLSTTPDLTASVLTAALEVGLDVPVLGSSPSFDPTLLDGPAAGALGNFHLTTSSPPFASPTPRSRQIGAAYKRKYPATAPDAGVQAGYLEGMVWQAVLTRACVNGDLSRAGVVTARTGLAPVQTDGLSAPLDYSSPGLPPTRGVYISRVDPEVEGGLTEVAPLSTVPEADDYRTPTPEVG